MPPSKPLGLTSKAETNIIRRIRGEWEIFVRDRAHRGRDGSLVYSERLLAELGEMGLATLAYLARRGDREAARLLVERLLGLPEQPFHVRVQNLSLAESKEYLQRELVAMNLAPETAGAFVDRLDEVSRHMLLQEERGENDEKSRTKDLPSEDG